MSLSQHRRALHQIPELSFDLPKTLSYIESVLKELPCTLLKPATSSLCAYFDFGKEDTLAFRADMDALPIMENTGLAFASRHEGKMHACGHDGHMAILLSFAQWVAQQKRLPHNVLLIFQPSEETVGGAKPICESGILARHKVKAVFGLHLWPDLPVGVVATRPGSMMCRSSEVTLTVTGKSAHVARSEEGLDALDAAMRWLLGAKELEESLPKNVLRLLKMGKMEAGTVRNAVAGSARLEGTLRSFEDETFDYLKKGLERLTAKIQEESGCRLELTVSPSYPAVHNDPVVYDRVKEILSIEYLEKPVKIAEDFSWYQRFVPGVFFFLGCGPAPALHSQNFDFDETALEKGLSLFQALEEEY